MPSLPKNVTQSGRGEGNIDFIHALVFAIKH